MARAAPAAAAGLPRGLAPLIAIDLRQASIAEGLRAALATASVVALNNWLQWPPLREAALAALFTCLCDPGGPIRRRLPAILSFAVLGTLVTVAYGVLREAPLIVVVPIACAGVFASAFARISGQAAQQVGNLLTVVQVLALTRTIGDVATAAELGGGFLGGSLWAAIVTLLIWRVYPFLPARRAVADAYRALAALAQDLRRILRREDAGEHVWDAHARGQRRRVREAIERARAAVLATLRTRGPVSNRAAQTIVRLETADQIFVALVGLSDVLASGADAAARGAAEALLRRLGPLLTLIARGIETDAIERLPRLSETVDAIARSGAASPLLRGAAEVLAERLRLAVGMAAPEGWQPGTAPDEPVSEVFRRVVARIRANLDWQSEILRHALRAAAAAAPAFAITLHWPTSYGHWMTIMLVMTLQPYVAITFARALERIGGTLAGGLIAAGLATFCTTPLAMSAALFPLAVLAFALRPASFGLFMTAMTPLVVLLSELGTPGRSEFEIAAMRGLYALVGSGLAVLAVMLLWPAWEPGRVRRELAAAIAAHGAYVRAEIAALLGEAAPGAVDRARRAAGIASNNLEACLHRALLEPRPTDPRLEPALTVDAALRRIGGRVSALQLDRTPRADPAAWRAWADWIEQATRALAAGLADLPLRPALPEGDAQADSLARIARQMELAASALRRLA
jgi:uncharacterized membrane protein YccC